MSSATRILVRVLLIGILWGPGPRALALDAALDVSQYAHTAWRIREGFAKGTIKAIAQTPDGFLWLGTDFGLMRFDGVRATAWQPGPGRVLPGSAIRNLLVARDGALWIATDEGLARWSHGELVTYPQFEGWIVNGLAQDRQGTVWASASLPTGKGLLCAIGSGTIDCQGRGEGLGALVTALSEDRVGNLWLATKEGLWRWQPGPPRLFSLPDQLVDGPLCLAGTSTDGILALTAKGAFEIIEGKVRPYWVAPAAREGHPRAVLNDRDGAVWVGNTEGGLFHFHNGRMDEFGLSDGLSGNLVWALFEDREGNVWVSTDDGLDRFRALAASIYSTRQGLIGYGASVLADRNGDIWFSTSAGLYRRGADYTLGSKLMDEFRVRGRPELPPGTLFQDHTGRVWLGTMSGLGHLEHNHFAWIVGVPVGYIDSIAEDRDRNLWIANRDAGLIELSPNGVVRQTPWTKISQNGPASHLAVDSVQGGLWLGFFSGGIAHLVDGQVHASYGPSEGLGRGRVNELRMASDGALWVATGGGLSRLKAGRIAALTTRDGLPCDNVDSSIEDASSLWVYTSCGLVRITVADLRSWIAVVDEGQMRWSRIPLTLLDDSDGIRSFPSISSFSPHIAKTAEGALWLVSQYGLTVVDPRHLSVNRLPPPVHVERIIADRKLYEGHPSLKLPPLPRDLQIDYTALSLVAPERVLFRYKLEGRDRDWQNAGNRRQAFYSDLPPGNYRFHVIASNNSGVWNNQGATLDFTIAPAYWQTNWFRALCALAILALLWMAYLVRVRQLKYAFNMKLEARLGERMRIARDLHDTLLQSFQGLLLRFQTVAAMLPKRAEEAKDVVLSAVDQAAQAITEGRRAVQGLRSPADESRDFATDLMTAGELAARETGNESVTFRVEVEGSPRTLHPIVRDDVYRIACEALRNAFRHAQAHRIELELEYHERQLRLRVRDDGQGMDPKILEGDGQTGHFGLHGMRERAKLIDGQLDVWSAPGSGTEVELIIPASRAYAAK